MFMKFISKKIFELGIKMLLATQNFAVITGPTIVFHYQKLANLKRCKVFNKCQFFSMVDTDAYGVYRLREKR